jgi:AAA+ ATPase superfamily predicted ATPase
MDLELIGKEEQIILQDLYESNRPEFLAIYGRRIGKTYLIWTFLYGLWPFFAI